MLQGKPPNVRSMLLTLGVDSYLADMAIPFVWFIPGAVDPDSQSVIEIIRALQRGLRKAGFTHIRVTGVLNSDTARALDQVSPPRGSWMQKTFVQLMGDVIAATKNPGGIDLAGALGSYFEYDGVPPGPLPGYMVGLPPGPLGVDGWWDDAVEKAKSIIGGGAAPPPSSGPALNFGKGRDPSNIVPIPKKSGLAYTAFKNLQRQINRLLSKVGGRIGEDGIIGKKTLAGFKKAQTVVGQSIGGGGSTLDLARNAVGIAAKLQGVANSMGIPTSVNRGAAATPTSAKEPEPVTPYKAGVMDSVKTYAPFLAIAGGVAWYVSTQRKKKRRA